MISYCRKILGQATNPTCLPCQHRIMFGSRLIGRVLYCTRWPHLLIPALLLLSSPSASCSNACSCFKLCNLQRSCVPIFTRIAGVQIIHIRPMNWDHHRISWLPAWEKRVLLHWLWESTSHLGFRLKVSMQWSMHQRISCPTYTSLTRSQTQV